MAHYRILEKKIGTKQYIIEYLEKTFLGFYRWKNLNNISYTKYEEALTAVKKVIVQEDYETTEFGYHYIDAYKIFKTIKK